LITFGIYQIIWLIITRNELLQLKAADKIMHPLLVLIPIVGPILFLVSIWQYSAGVEKVTKGKYSAIVAFLLLFLIGFIGAGLIQGAYNEVGEGGGSGDPFGGNA
jgi:hypothetical protein